MSLQLVRYGVSNLYVQSLKSLGKGSFWGVVEEFCRFLNTLVDVSGAYAGGGSGGSGEPPFFQINYIHSMAWHACLACK